MAIKRTKHQKQQANLRHDRVLSYNLSELEVKNIVSPNMLAKKPAEGLGFDFAALKKDLLKTFLVTALVVGVLITYTIYQR